MSGVDVGGWISVCECRRRLFHHHHHQLFFLLSNACVNEMSNNGSSLLQQQQRHVRHVMGFIAECRATFTYLKMRHSRSECRPDCCTPRCPESGGLKDLIALIGQGSCHSSAPQWPGLDSRSNSGHEDLRSGAPGPKPGPGPGQLVDDLVAGRVLSRDPIFTLSAVWWLCACSI